MRFIKNSIIVLIVLSLLVGCSTKKKEGFSNYVESLPKQLLSGDDLSLNYLFVDPTQYGIDVVEYKLPFTSKEQFAENMNFFKEWQKQLREFDSSVLTKEEKLTYDVLDDYFVRVLRFEDQYDLNERYLGSFLGLQAQLPLLLEGYQFFLKKDIDNYIALLKSTPSVFTDYINLEKERNKTGFGLSQTVLDKIIEQCTVVSKQTDYFLEDNFLKKLNAFPDLTAQEKEEYIQKYHDALYGSFIAGYGILADGLKQIDGSQYNDMGLAMRKGGKEYYANLVKSVTGIDKSIKEIKKYLENRFDTTLAEMQDLMKKDKTIIDRYMASTYSSLNTFEDVMQHLQTNIDKDFPSLANIQYEVKLVDESMKDNFSPAAYLTSRIDTPLTQNELIYINGSFEDDLFLTLAHEGYPGHMYQNVYYKSLNQPTIRYLLNYSGYSEGWAKYIEDIAIFYSDMDEDVAQLKVYNDELSYIFLCQMDIAIHYDGITKEEFAAAIQSFYSNVSEESIQSQYELFLEEPTNVLMYYLSSFHFMDLKEYAEKELKEQFSLKEFHQVILDTGPSSFKILEDQVKEYVKSK